jgi:hypothetical protein
LRIFQRSEHQRVDFSENNLLVSESVVFYVWNFVDGRHFYRQSKTCLRETETDMCLGRYSLKPVQDIQTDRQTGRQREREGGDREREG